MATTFKELFVSTGTSITITLAGLGSGAAREGTAIDNTSNLYLDAMVYFTLTTHTTLTGADNALYVYAYGSNDGVNYDSPATGSDAAVSTPTNLTLVKACATGSKTNTALKFVIGSIASAFGGVLPPKWGVVVENETGGSLNAGSMTYTGIQAQGI